MIAVLQAKGAGLWTRSHIRNNVVAGIVVGVVALPLAMAFAIASGGARPEQGLYTSIVAGVLTSLFGGTRVQISGPTGAFIAVLSIITAQHGNAGLQIATLMAGVILVAFGFARLGAVIKYIPNPVIVGFTAGIGVIIFVGQWKDFFGLAPGPAGLHFHEKMWMADAVSVEQHVDTTATAFDILGPKPDSGVVIYSIEGPLFFGAAEKLERTLAHIQRPATTLILRMGSVPFIDATGINALEEMVGDFKRHGASVLLVELRPNVRYKLERAGVIAQIGEAHIIDTLDNALQLTKQSKTAGAKPSVDV